MAASNRNYKDCDLTDQLLERRNSYTPDFLDRKLEKHIPVFVYGTLKSGFDNHKFLDGSQALGEAYTTTTSYVMEKCDSGAFPVVYALKSAHPTGQRIYGEVYLVSARHLLNVDVLEKNGQMYQRELRFVHLLEQSFKTKNGSMRPSLKCWIYLGLESFWVHHDTKGMKSKEIENMRVYEWEAEKFRPFNPLRPALLEKYEAESRVAFGPTSSIYPIG
jgi:gamma-glutamylcyclotransferase (GGCT)/AIG2-like uncharacterized protein YtfP